MEYVKGICEINMESEYGNEVCTLNMNMWREYMKGTCRGICEENMYRDFVNGLCEGNM